MPRSESWAEVEVWARRCTQVSSKRLVRHVTLPLIQPCSEGSERGDANGTYVVQMKCMERQDMDHGRCSKSLTGDQDHVRLHRGSEAAKIPVQLGDPIHLSTDHFKMMSHRIMRYSCRRSSFLRPRQSDDQPLRHREQILPVRSRGRFTPSSSAIARQRSFQCCLPAGLS
jgi:hypothetical protein